MAAFLRMLPGLLSQAGKSGVFSSLRDDAKKTIGEEESPSLLGGGFFDGLKSFAGDVLSDLGNEGKIKSGADFGRSLARAAANALGVGNNAANNRHDEVFKKANKSNLDKDRANMETTVMAKAPFSVDNKKLLTQIKPSMDYEEEPKKRSKHTKKKAPKKPAPKKRSRSLYK